MASRRVSSPPAGLKHAGLPLASTDTPDAQKRRKADRRAAKRDRGFTAWIHTQPCVVCGTLPVEQHHYPPRSNPSWHDHFSTPCCPEHHRGKEGWHTLGHELFTERHGISLTAKALELRGKYLSEQGEKHEATTTKP